jgi:5-methylcytosine-specific restriction enzyme A
LPQTSQVLVGPQGGKRWMKIHDLPEPITASKSDWLAGTTWIGFTPTDGGLTARNRCQSTIRRQFGSGYVIEYITEKFGEPNPGFENDPQYLSEREAHKELAGRFIAVHKLRATARPLLQILGQTEFELLQDMWAANGNRNRWSVAFPIIASYRVIGRPKAKAVLGEDSYTRLYAHSSATLRPLNDQEQLAVSGLEIEPVGAPNAWIGIEDEISIAEKREIDPRVRQLIAHDMSDRALEGISAEKRARLRTRAAWIANNFVRNRFKQKTLQCDRCGFDPSVVVDSALIRLRSLLDVHHRRPLEEGVRYTTSADFELLCPTCHRIEHAILNAGGRGLIVHSVNQTSTATLSHLRQQAASETVFG